MGRFYQALERGGVALEKQVNRKVLSYLRTRYAIQSWDIAPIVK